MKHTWLGIVRIACAVACLIFLANSEAAAQGTAGSVSGEAVYQRRCASCHDQAESRAPNRNALQSLSKARILRTLDFGLMMGVAYPMRRDEREAVANLLGTAEDTSALPPAAFCAAGNSPLARQTAANWNGWSPSPSNARYQSAEHAGLGTAQVRRLKLKWALGYPGDVIAFAAPTVLNGTIFVGSASGAVQAVDAASGCIHWVFQAGGPVRAAPMAAPLGASSSTASSTASSTTSSTASSTSYALLFGDQIGWYYSVDAKTGKLLWKRRVEDHEATRLTGTSAVHDGVVFVPAASWEEARSLDPQYACCTFRGSVSALRVRDGAVLWKSYLVDAPKRTGVTSVGTAQWGPSGSPVWSTPTVDARRGLLYITTGDNYSFPATATSDAIMALNMKTGRTVWTHQTLPGDVYNSSCRTRGVNCPPNFGPDYDYGAAPILIRAANGREILAAGQKSGVVYGLDPDQKGKLLWQQRVGKGAINGGVQWGMASDGQNVYAAVSDVSAVMNTAGPVGGSTFDPAAGGGLTALRVSDGSKAWFVPSRPCAPPRPGCSPGQSSALTVIPGVVFSPGLDGHLRAYATEDGEVLWDFDTAKEYTTVNGVPAKGGSIDGAGAVVVGGMVFVNSGYPRNGGMAGNVLLAFTPEE